MSEWIIRPLPVESAPARLVCVAQAGAGTGAFHAWLSTADPPVELALVRLPGRERRWREAPLRHMDVVAAELASALAEHVNPPYALFGNCHGALVAFETARELRRRALPGPVALYVAGRPGPRGRTAECVSEAGREELVGVMRALGSTSDAVLRSEELLDRVLPAVRADLALVERYRYRLEPPLAVPIVVVGETDGWAAEWAAETCAGLAAIRRAGAGERLLQDATILCAIASDLLARLADRG